LGILFFLMLVGEKLISFCKAHDGLNQMQLARGAGYVRETKAGKVQVLVKTFYNELLKAQGMPIPVGNAAGKPVQYRTHVHKNGAILLGKSYAAEFGLQPGDELQIVMADDGIKLVPVVEAPAKTTSETRPLAFAA